MQIKTTHLIPGRIAKNKNQATASALKDVEKEEHSSIVGGGLQAGTATLEISMVVPQKIGHSTT